VRGDQAQATLPREVGLLRQMMLIRAFERELLRNPGCGFQLLSSGEEAVAVGVCAGLAARDMLLTSGRSIGPALARGLDPGAVLAELLGKSGGPCRGRAGRGHLSQPSAGFFGAHAVVGGNLAVSVGAALAAQMEKQGAIVVCVFGDGACGAGILYESLNLASIWKLPLVFVCNNNQYSVSTPAASVLAPRTLSELAAPFRIPASTVDGMNVLEVSDAMTEAATRARSGGGPGFIECRSCRFFPHSTVTRETRAPEEIARGLERCPIRTLERRLRERNELDDASLAGLTGQIGEELAAACRLAEASPYPDPGEALREVD
jgi:TPP-dependent pyruvate/acetoin dehydrogenase alpha subunit